LAAIPGTYALVIFLPRDRRIKIGALGTFRFPRGNYLYIGSAQNGLGGRIARHLRPRKKKFWHIDYFLAHATITEFWTHGGTEKFECLWAQAALQLPKTKVIAPRLGASDCRCAAHLIYFGTRLPSRPR
jgi:Uri superfamily endonuclease